MEGLFEDKNYSFAFNRKSIRKNFTKKVFSIVGIQLFLTLMIVSLFRNIYFLSKVSDSLYLISIVGSLITSLVLTCSRQTARTYPKNYYILGVFTFCEAIMLENFLAYYNSDIIYQALFMTALLMGSLGFFAQQTTVDFTSGKYLGYLLMIHLGFIFFGFFFFSFHSVLYSVVMLMILCAYVVVDLQMIMGDKNRALQIDDYVLASVILYTDIIQIFMRLVELLNENSDNKGRRIKKRR